MKGKSWALILLVSIFGCNKRDALPVVQQLDANWFFSSKNTDNWMSATVPGNIHTDLLAHQIIEDPFIKSNEQKVQWVSDSSWTYKTTFNADKGILHKKNITLNFDGLDTYAKVYLNDSLILTADNAFLKYSTSIAPLLKKTNELRVEFTSTKLLEEQAASSLAYTLPEGNRIFTRKAQFQYGWDWGPKLNTSGIWKKVYLRAWNDIVISDVYVKQHKISEKQATLLALVTIENNSEQPSQIVIKNQGELLAKLIQIKKGLHTYEIPLLIKDPKLWWPHNIGIPHLYEFDFEVVVDNEVRDRKKVKTGIRDIVLITEKDSIGESFYFKVNDVPVFMKGANYIPQNSFQNKVTKEHYSKLLNDVVDANMNMLRVWGGGIYENDDFYEICDEKGILIWQDFMFACAMYPGDESFLNTIQQEANDQVTRLRNHPSIALWCGNNENSEGWHRWGWQQGRSAAEKEEIWRNYLKVFDSILPATVSKLSTTSYWESSPKFGRGNPKYKTEGDAHDWWVWHDGYPFEHFISNTPRFMSEFGFQSFPSYDVINFINQKDSVAIHTPAMKSHQKHSRGFQLIEEYMSRDYPKPNNDREYVYLSQLTQARGITMAIEAHRRARPYTMGTLYWQLNDCWPAISWSSIDYFGNWKALHFKAKRAFENNLITSEINKGMMRVFLINDTPVYYKDTVNLRIIDFNGKQLWSHQEVIAGSFNDPLLLKEIPLQSLDIDFRKSVLVSSSFLLDDKHHYFVKPKELVLSKGNIEWTSERAKDGFVLKLTSKVLQKDVFLYTQNKGHFSDNFFDISPNVPVYIYFETQASNLDDLKIQSLNTIFSE